MSISNRLRSALVEKGYSEGELARRSGTKQPTVHRILSGESTSPRRENIEKIARALQVSPDWLFFGTEAPRAEQSPLNATDFPIQNVASNATTTKNSAKNAITYPLISWEAAGKRQKTSDVVATDEADEWIASPENAGARGYWLEVKSPSMQPQFVPSTRVLVKPDGFDLISGKLYIARIKNSGETTFKQYLRDGGNDYLQPFNPAFPVTPIDENVEIIGMVIAGQLPPSLF
jgi:SOS-response transcriptional repressor LexA